MKTAAKQPQRAATGKPSGVQTVWAYRLAWLLTVMTLVLVVIGGLVTTYEAGMSVVDWPTTYGHWFYPIQKWIFSYWDMFLEHGHRLWAQLTGSLAIGLGVLLIGWDRRRVAIWIGGALIAGALLQGTLGGLRVWWHSNFLAMIHGCTAALFFALTAATVVTTAPDWRESSPRVTNPRATLLKWLGLSVLVGLYVEIVLGAQLRHPLPEVGPGWAMVWVWSKIILAAAVYTGCVALWLIARRALGKQEMPARRLRATSGVLFGVMSVQLALAAATWVTNYGWPLWFRRWVVPLEYTVVAEGGLQVTITTLHVAVGALAMATALVYVLWAFRTLAQPAAVPAADGKHKH
ncbi:MAG: COX15/CtaA family protein [Planctomycetota bacterium]